MVNEMVKKVILFVGVFGVGKSYQCDRWIEEHPEYKLMNTTTDIDQMIQEMQGHDYWVGDYYFHLDEQAKRLRDGLGCEIEFRILFDKPEVIVQRQLDSKPESPLSPKSCWLVWDVYMKQLVSLYDLPETKFFDGEMNNYTKDEFVERFKSFYDDPSKEEVKEFLDKLETMPSYDKHYHNFDLPHGFKVGNDAPTGKKEYAMNDKTWEVIKDWVDWKGKRVLDLCGFHFYFCQQIFKEGGKPTGMDRSTAVIHTGSMFAKWNKTEFYTYNYDIDNFTDDEGYTKFPPGEYDMVMLFNVLHHLTHKERLLRTMAKYPSALFEVNTTDRILIEKHFKVVREQTSPKANRVILLCEPK